MEWKSLLGWLERSKLPRLQFVMNHRYFLKLQMEALLHGGRWATATNVPKLCILH